MRNLLLFISSILILTATSCKDGAKGYVAQEEQENMEAKKMLQGIWIDDEDGEVTMKVKGDTIIYSDTTMAAVAFKIVNDSLVVKGYTESRYAIKKQSANIFQFLNHNGDVVKLIKSTDPNDAYVFEHRKPIAPLNQNQLIKRDTVVFVGDHKYHIYVQVNPSKYKVIATSYNNDGIQVDNVYYDNIINVCVYDGGNRLFSRDVHKQDLKAYVPADFLTHSVLSDVTLDKVTADGIEFLASVCSPDSPLYYAVRMKILKSGQLKMSKE